MDGSDYLREIFALNRRIECADALAEAWRKFQGLTAADQQADPDLIEDIVKEMNVALVNYDNSAFESELS